MNEIYPFLLHFSVVSVFILFTSAEQLDGGHRSTQHTGINQKNFGLGGKKSRASSVVVEETGVGTAQSSLGEASLRTSSLAVQLCGSGHILQLDSLSFQRGRNLRAPNWKLKCFYKGISSNLRPSLS